MINMEHVRLLKGLKHKHDDLNGEPVDKTFRRLLSLKAPEIRLEQLPYNDQWPQWFAKELLRLNQQGNELGLSEVQHIGSTSIEGMTSKGIIDMVAVSLFMPDDETVQALMAKLGYEFYGSSPINEKSCWYWRVETDRCYVIHLANSSQALFVAPCLFRDYLRAEPDKRDLYQAYKIQALADSPDLFSYSVRKMDAYCDILADAEKWKQSKFHKQSALTD
ncbi:hypothetical protein GCM10007978_16800 [Shewanella hanedai]|uniref:GrpB family protein n=1 Tax=Shewanella hanedai TaxID=25 RepID=A0A553JSJ1_SHEHA|nr:GrpB family protein [Shewanella hanedai]TRY15419.1 GrpB family protein [Shewanella hanedai]GGI79614.1 hypothetical protein GCM10007978_16800 [Shewanella hanedai]